jgi:hypothetical protein
MTDDCKIDPQVFVQLVAMTWVQHKAIPAYCAPTTTKFKNLYHVHHEESFDRTNCIYEFIPRSRASPAHYQCWVIHKENVEEYRDNIAELREKYNVVLMNEMQGHLFPECALGHTLEWMVNGHMVISELIPDWTQETRDLIVEKETRLKSVLPSEFKVSYKIS